MAVTQISRIQHRRGKDTDLPEALAEGEIGMATNTGEIFMGAPSWDRVQHRKVGAASPMGIYPYANIKLLTEFDVAHTLSDTVYYHGPLLYMSVSSGTVSAVLQYVYGVDDTEEPTEQPVEPPVEPPVEEPAEKPTPTDPNAETPTDSTPIEDAPEEPTEPAPPPVVVAPRQTRYTFLKALPEDQRGAIVASLSIESRHGTSSAFVMNYDNVDPRTGRRFYEEMIQIGNNGTVVLDLTPARLQVLASTDNVNLTYHPAQTIYRVPLSEADSMVIDYSVQSANAFPNEQVQQPGARRVGTLHVVADDRSVSVRDDHVELNRTNPMRVIFSGRVELQNDVPYMAVTCVNAHGQPMDVVFNGRRWSSKRF